MTTILVPLDDSELSHHALPTAVWLARGLAAEVMLVTVGPFPESEAQRVEGRSEARDLLHRASATLAGLTVRAVLSTHNDPAKGILSVIAEAHPDLVVMSTHGRGAWAELVEGSVAAEVVRAAGVPVTLVHPPTTA